MSNRQTKLDKFLTKQAKARQDEIDTMRNNAGGGMRVNEGRLAEYLYDRRMLNKAIEGTTLTELRSANQSVEATRTRLSSGKGNVNRDINRSGLEHDSSRRTTVARDMVDRMKANEGGNISNARFGLLSASAAEYTRAGNCGEHADLVTHIHASQLTNDKNVYRVDSSVTDHAWAELSSSDNQMRDEDVIMDPWATGSAVLREDAAFAHNRKVTTTYSYNQNQGAQAAQQQQQIFQQIGSTPSESGFAHKRYAKLINENYKWGGDVWAPTPVTLKKFTQDADKAHNKLVQRSQYLAGIVAAGVARSLGDNVKQATKRADRVVPHAIGTNWE